MSDAPKIRAMNDVLIVLPPPPDQTTASGIHLAAKADRSYRYGKVLSVGPLVHEKSGMDIKVGDVVTFEKNATRPHDLSGLLKTEFHAVPALGCFLHIPAALAKQMGLRVPQENLEDLIVGLTSSPQPATATA